MRKILMTICLVGAFFVCTSPVAAETIFNGETIDIGESGEYRYETDNYMVAAVNQDGLVKAKSEGETTVRVKEKKLLRWVDKKEIPIKVVNGGSIVISPLEDTYFEPDLVLYDSKKREIRHFGLGEEVYALPGTYYVKEWTKSSSLSDKFTKIALMVGDKKEIHTAFTSTTTLTFETDDKEITEVEVWKKSGEEYKKHKTLKVRDGKVKTEIRSGNYAWINGKARAPHPIKIGEKEAYPFGVGENPMTIKVNSAASSAVEAVSLSENARENAKKVYDSLMAYGASPVCASAIIGNMYGESGVRASAIERGGGGGHGLCQWTGGRWHNLKAHADSLGREWTDIEVQIDFLIKELNGYNMDEFWGSQSVEEATEIFMRRFERPAEWVYATSLPKRIGAAKRVYEQYAGVNEL